VREFNGKGRPRHGHAGARSRQLRALEASSKGAFVEGGISSAADRAQQIERRNGDISVRSWLARRGAEP
jgi:hypothetical protein